MKVNTHIITTQKGYVKSASIYIRHGKYEVDNIEYTPVETEAKLFPEQDLLQSVEAFEFAIGIKKGQGMGFYRYIPKKYIFSTPRDYIYELEVSTSGKILDVAFTPSLQDAKIFKENELERTVKFLEEYLGIKLHHGFGYSAVKLGFTKD